MKRKTQNMRRDSFIYGNISHKKERQQKVEKATGFLKWATTEKEVAYAKYQDYISSTAALDFMTYDSDEVRRKGEELEEKYKSAVHRVENARKELWSAKYDTMSDLQLQAALAEAEDDEEKAYIKNIQNTQVAEQRERDLKIMLQRGDPESVLYDPDFSKKSEYRSTKLTDGSWGESDTGYADIDYEFINGNPEISELIVGLDRNYRYFSDYERQVYNYWHNYDREHGTNVADNYLNLLQETLNDRDRQQDYSEMEGDKVKEALYGAQAYLSTIRDYINIAFSKRDKYIPMTAAEMTVQQIYNDLADVGGTIKINGKSPAQLAFDFLDNSVEDIPVFGGLYAGGKAYKDVLNRGYTQEQAYTTVNGEVAKNVASYLTGESLGALWNLLPPDSATDAIGKILDETDWLGATNMLESAIDKAVEEHAPGSTVSGSNIAIEKARKTAQGVVTAKGLDKIIKQTQGNANEISPDLRQALLESLKDPEIRAEVENTGSFTSTQLDEIIAKLETAENGDPGLGTYVGNAAYGPDGYTINRQMLQQWADQAIRQRGRFANDPIGKALYERYKNLR